MTTASLYRSLFTGILCCILLNIAKAQDSNGCNYRFVHIGLCYPLSTNGAQAATYTNGFSFHALAGVSRSEKSFCLSGLVSVVKEDATGIMLSGLVNKTGNETDGVQMAGIANKSKNITGVQIAGLGNAAINATGLQLAGIANIAQHNKGLQLAGVINIAGDADNQLAGLINIAKRVSGMQAAGFINIADECEYPIGIINIIKNGERQIGITIDEGGNSVLAFRSGSRKMYGILGLGYNFNREDARYILEAGIGMHLPVTGWARINIEGASSALSDVRYSIYYKSSLRALAEVKLANRISAFAGPSLNYLAYPRGQYDIQRDHYIWKHTGFNVNNGIYIGAIAGIQFNI